MMNRERERERASSKVACSTGPNDQSVHPLDEPQAQHSSSSRALKVIILVYSSTIPMCMVSIYLSISSGNYGIPTSAIRIMYRIVIDLDRSRRNPPILTITTCGAVCRLIYSIGLVGFGVDGGEARSRG